MIISIINRVLARWKSHPSGKNIVGFKFRRAFDNAP